MQSVIWGVNAFDQWGVELGKVLAGALVPLLGPEPGAAHGSLDASTAGLVARVRARRAQA